MQGLNDYIKQTHIADDLYKFCLAAIMEQETHIKETGLHEFTSSDGKKVCLYDSMVCLYNSIQCQWWKIDGAKSAGVGIITTENTKVILT